MSTQYVREFLVVSNFFAFMICLMWSRRCQRHDFKFMEQRNLWHSVVFKITSDVSRTFYMNWFRCVSDELNLSVWTLSELHTRCWNRSATYLGFQARHYAHACTVHQWTQCTIWSHNQASYIILTTIRQFENVLKFSIQ